MGKKSDFAGDPDNHSCWQRNFLFNNADFLCNGSEKVMW